MLEGSEYRYYTEGDINTPNYTWVEYIPEFIDTTMITDDQRTRGRYMRIGNTVWWHVEINFEGVTFDSTSELWTTIPFEAAMHTDSAAGSLHDVSSNKTHGIKGHYEQYSKRLQLFYVNNVLEDTAMTSNDPVTLSTQDYLHICGWYEAVPYDQAI